ncbi:solute carrier organic anion transporter family member 1C1 isoform 3-T4 [Anableps anableps]
MEDRSEEDCVQENGRGDGTNNKPSSSQCTSLKMFLVALSFAYFAKALSGSYMKSTITQLERRFDIPSYLIGVIDGSFEIGNLLVIAFVSYFGAKLHRPKIIALGCLLMSFGTFVIALPHFIIGRYEFETSVRWVVNSTQNSSPCQRDSPGDLIQAGRSPQVPSTSCEGESNLSMWIYVLLGNVLRGIGETPVQPLGISYIDDFATEENAALYVGCVQTISVVGPVFGYLLGSLCAKIYVDIGFVKMETITITPADARWVGAWWLGYLIAGVITLLSAIPFWFLPRSLPTARSTVQKKCTQEEARFIKDTSHPKYKYQAEEHSSFIEMAKDFIPTLRTLLGHPVYVIYLCVVVIQLNSLIGMVTYKPKYIEQHFRQSASKANFLMGVINIPAVALGMFSGGLLMKRLKLNIMGAAKFAFGTSLIGYVLSMFFFAMSCENAKVAGVTVSYNNVESVSYDKHSLFMPCNSDCFCSSSEWDPVCGQNGITYVSPCLAGCTTSTGSGKNTVHKTTTEISGAWFSCFGDTYTRRHSKPLLLHCGSTAGIPAPIYFGAIIDTTCLKWGQKRCGGIGACRIYNTSAYRIAYLGLTLSLRTISFIICIPGFILLSRQLKAEGKKSVLHEALTNGGTELEALRKEECVILNPDQAMHAMDNSTERHTQL